MQKRSSSASSSSVLIPSSMIKDELPPTETALNQSADEVAAAASASDSATMGHKSMPVNETMKKDANTNMAAFKLMLLVLMVLQNSSTVLVGRYTRSSGTKESLFVVNHLVMITEVGKVRCGCGYCYEIQ